MFSGFLLLLISIAYVGSLFAIAWLGDRRAVQQTRPRHGPLVYSLSLAVYCTSWTFFGAVGTAARSGWAYLPIYLGPVLFFVLSWRLMDRLIRVSKAQNITSIADFVAARYGKSQTLAVLVTVVGVIGVVPYIALQLKAVAGGYAVLTGDGGATPGGFPDTAFLIAMAMALFAILFGTRQLDATENHHGMILAVAFESLVKLFAFVAVGLFATFGLLGGPGEVLSRISADAELAALFSPRELQIGFFAQTLLAFLCIFCLPRQFHVAVVENTDRRDLRAARLLFPLYLALFSIFVVPIAVAGLATVGRDGVDVDSFVLLLPLTADRPALALLAFLGGLSAATGMVIVATIALSTMICNDIVVPLLLGARRGPGTEGDLSRLLLQVRRGAIVALLVGAYLYYRLTTGMEAPLASLGLLAFVAVAQFAPAVIGAVYWREGTATGAMRGMAAGFALWLYTLLLPTLVRAGLLPQGLLTEGLAGIAWLRPEALLGLAGLDPITHGLFWSLAANTAAYVFFSLGSRQSVVERIQAAAFADPTEAEPARQASLPWRSRLTVGDLRTLLERFAGAEQARRLFARLETDRGYPLSAGARADAELARRLERELASIIGASSARVVMTSALRGSGLQPEDVAAMLDETSQVLLFNQELLQATMENVSQGISVIDPELQLVAWNRRYLELFQYPEGLVRVGRPVADLVRYNAERGLCGPGDVQAHVDKRIGHLRAGNAYRYQREWPDGRSVELQGRPMPGGGFVTTFTDVTAYKATERALRESEQSIRFYTDNLPALVAYIDREQRFRFTNRAYEAMVGRSRERILGEPASEVFDEAEYRRRSRHIDAALAGERQRFDLEMVDPRGRRHYMLATYVPDLDEKGRARGMFAVFQDITERREAELALREAKDSLERRVSERTSELLEVNAELIQAKSTADRANRSKTHFIAAASHDLLQPLNAARLFTSALLQADLADTAKIERLGSQIDSSLKAAESLLNALLDISKLDAGGIRAQPSAFALNELFETLNGEFHPLAQAEGTTFRYVATKLTVYTDAGLLRRILQNFLSNAVRYTDRGRVLLGCRRRGGQVSIQVWDDGPGIAGDKLDLIFEEFQRLDAGRGGDRGLGLGLAITRRIAGILDARVEVHSRPGHGSLFAVTVPVATARAAPALAPALAPARDRLAGLKILCIDNDAAILAGMRELCGGWGCDVTAVSTLTGAAAAFPDDGALPDIVVADYHLDDEKTGVDVLRQLMSLWRRSVPSVVITADYTDAVREAVLADGHFFMRKPIKPARMRALFNNVVAERGRRRRVG